MMQNFEEILKLINGKNIKSSDIIKFFVDIKIIKEFDISIDNVDEKEDLDIYDVILPKMVALLGSQGFIDIHNGKSIDEVLSSRGLSVNDKIDIENLLKEKYDSYNNGLEDLYKVSSDISNLFSSYVPKMMNNLSSNEKASLKEAIDNGVFTDNKEVILGIIDQLHMQNNVK